MNVGDILDWVDRCAPFDTQADFDNSGLVLGDPKAEVHKVLFALDVTPAVAQEAADFGAQLVVTHHPLLFDAVKRIRYDDPLGLSLRILFGGGISLISAHTNLDQAEGGTGDCMAKLLGLTGVAAPASTLYIRTGKLPAPEAATAFLTRVDAAFSTHARLYGAADAAVSRVAVGAGACGELYVDALQAGMDTFVVGEIKHHHLLAARALGLTVIEAGHFATEQPGLVALYQRFTSDTQGDRSAPEARLSAVIPYQSIVSAGQPAASDNR